jgi:stage V sporulation protein B
VGVSVLSITREVFKSRDHVVFAHLSDTQPYELGCLAGFLLFGAWIGNAIFHSNLAGDFLRVLAWLCPFLYVNNTMISILNGLGNATSTFVINALSLVLRILGIYLGIPHLGINGYLYGLLISQLFTSVCCIIYLRIILHKKEGA